MAQRTDRWSRVAPLFTAHPNIVTHPNRPDIVRFRRHIPYDNEGLIPNFFELGWARMALYLRLEAKAAERGGRLEGVDN